MKFALLISLLVSASTIPALAEDAQVVKTCNTLIKFPEAKDAEATIKISYKDGAYQAEMTKTEEGQSETVTDVSLVSHADVREGLTADSDPDTLNLSEALISHAMMMTSDPDLKSMFTTGFDSQLKDVRSAQVYTLGEPTHMGVIAIVEAKDQSGKVLGSFLGGFSVSPCK